MSEIYQQIGEKVKAKRQLLQLTQEDLAIAIDCKRTSIANLEAGRQCMPLDRLYSLCEFLELQILDLIPPSEIPDKNCEITIDGKTHKVTKRVFDAVMRISEMS